MTYFQHNMQRICNILNVGIQKWPRQHVFQTWSAQFGILGMRLESSQPSFPNTSQPDVPLHLKEALNKFESQVAGRPDSEIDLTLAAATLALHTDPCLNIEETVMHPLAKLGNSFRQKVEETLPNEMPLPAAMRPHALAGLLCEFLRSEGFSGCKENYYRPGNSMINVVLAERTGIPITLSLVYIEVAKAGGLVLRGVNNPGHFLIAYGGTKGHVGMLDAFANKTVEMPGASQSEIDNAQNKLMLAQSVSNRAFLHRMILNLVGAYARAGDLVAATHVAQYQKVLDAAASQKADA